MDYLKIAHSWFTEMWSQPNFDLVDQIVAPTYHPSWIAMKEQGPDLLKKEITYFRSIFPDLVYTIKASTLDGNRVWVWYHGKGTHLGEGWGMTPTGNETQFEGAAILFFSSDGKIEDLWDAFSMYDIFAGSGAVPSFWELNSSALN